MDSSHDTGLDRSQIVQSLSHWSQAVGGAGSSGDNLVFLSQVSVVYVVNDSREVVACWSRDNNLLCACSQMCRSLLLGGVETGALENYVYIVLAPRNLCSVCASIDLDLLAVYSDGILACSYSISVLVLALGGVILQQMSQHLRAGEVVDCNNFITLSVEHLTECQTTNTTKTINSYFNCHVKNTPYKLKKELSGDQREHRSPSANEACYGTPTELHATCLAPPLITIIIP